MVKLNLFRKKKKKGKELKAIVQKNAESPVAVAMGSSAADKIALFPDVSTDVKKADENGGSDALKNSPLVNEKDELKGECPMGFSSVVKTQQPANEKNELKEESPMGVSSDVKTQQPAPRREQFGKQRSKSIFLLKTVVRPESYEDELPEEKEPTEEKKDKETNDLGGLESPKLKSGTNIYRKEANRVIDILGEVYGADTGFRNIGDSVVVTEGWNKALAFVTSWNEAMAARWRIEVAFRQLQEKAKAGSDTKCRLYQEALDQVETNADPIAKMLGTRVHHLRTLITGLVDAAVRTLSPNTQRIQREAYHPMSNDLLLGDGEGAAGGTKSELRHFALQEGTVKEYGRLFARCGVQPKHWLAFADAFLWTMRTHVPYADETDAGDLDLPNNECAHSIFCASHICQPCIKESLQLREELDTPLFKVGVPRFWKRIASCPMVRASIGESFYRELLTNNPRLLDYFVKADVDSLSLHIVALLDLLVKSVESIGSWGNRFRSVLDHLGEMHRRLGIPTFSFPIVGGQLLLLLQPHFDEEETLTAEEEVPVSAEDLEEAFATLYLEVMSIVYHPMIQEEKLVKDAEEFFNTVAIELKWSPDKLSKRLLEVKLEISNTGTYSHSSEELEIGARLCWRNSAKCIGRIAWNTLEVRDCRHLETPAEVFEEVKEHLRIATGGTNIQSVMTVFKPKSIAETWGLKFWSSQFVRYAGYKNEDGTITGDPGNLEFTDYLLERELWKPPEKKTDFDVLPLVLKVPGVRKPYVYQLPQEFVHEVHIEHPTCPAIKDLGLRWASVPAISDFNMNLGGIDYQCCPFNGWFVSIEVVRNLMERYKVQDRWADAMGLDKTQKMLDMRLQHEIQTAVLHSFEDQGFTMVDPEQVGSSFFVHCKRERDQGRECPAQWSWIGGLVGPTNVTWHKEMRDFKVLPQYEYCAEHWLTVKPPDEFALLESASELDLQSLAKEKESVLGARPRILIVYGSETGTAEAAASRLHRALKLLKPSLACLNDVAGLNIVKDKRITHLVAICSTFNRGEFPGNAKIFSESDIEPDILKGTKVAVCALGSSLYPDFCKAGITLERKLADAGAQTLASFTKVDDATGTDGPLSDWTQLIQRLILPPKLEDIIRSNLNVQTVTKHNIDWQKQLDVTEEVKRYTHVDSPDCMLCVCNDELIKGGDVEDRSTRKISFKLPEGVKYVAGDHLSVRPLNSIDSVMRFARIYKDELLEAAAVAGDCPFNAADNEDAMLAWQLQQPFSIKTTEDGETFDANLVFETPATLGEALQTSIDLTLHVSQVADYIGLIKGLITKEMPGWDNDKQKLRKRLLQLHNMVFEDSKQTRESSVNKILSEFPTILDFLETFGPLLCTETKQGEDKKEALLPLADILSVLPRLNARSYSISSSPNDDPSIVSITVGVVNVKTSAGVFIKGVCSNYLARIQPNEDFVSCGIRTSSFRGPPKLSSPVIMVGAGTGLAPMMGFLADRALELESCVDTDKAGKCLLYFGCRNTDDHIYNSTITKWNKSNVLEPNIAFSRKPSTPKTYVQDLIEQDSKNVCQLLLQPETCYYICGDARVADFCFEACVKALRAHGNMSRVAAVQHIKQMRAQNRWQYDLWGIIVHFNEAKHEFKVKKEAGAKHWLKRFT